MNLSYAESFGGRFGVQLNVGTNIVYTEQENGTTNYDFSNPTRGPFITQLTFRNGPKITRRDSFGANFDYKISDRLVFSLRTAGSHLNDEYINRQIAFIASAAQIQPSSTLTRVCRRPDRQREHPTRGIPRPPQPAQRHRHLHAEARL